MFTLTRLNQSWHVNQAVVFTEASLTGRGGTCLSHSVGGEWLTPPTAHVNVLELAAVRKVLLHFFHLVHGCHVLIRTDRGECAPLLFTERR